MRPKASSTDLVVYEQVAQSAGNAPPPMPKTKLGIVLPAAEASSTVHTTGQRLNRALHRALTEPLIEPY